LTAAAKLNEAPIISLRSADATIAYAMGRESAVFFSAA